ncbi:MAG: hypothetical protein JWQ79_2860 [Mucilaginibacter sp.]|jgi:hypothetical protein|nr:hypothetical protein [Mucilaginibacter sp.]
MKGNQNAAQHEDMAQTYVDAMSEMLVTYADENGINCPNSSRTLSQYCSDLAWGGLQYTDAFTSLSASDQTRILNTISAEQHHSTGSTAKKGC